MYLWKYQRIVVVFSYDRKSNENWFPSFRQNLLKSETFIQENEIKHVNKTCFNLVQVRGKFVYTMIRSISIQYATANTKSYFVIRPEIGWKMPVKTNFWNQKC